MSTRPLRGRYCSSSSRREFLPHANFSLDTMLEDEEKYNSLYLLFTAFDLVQNV